MASIERCLDMIQDSFKLRASGLDAHHGSALSRKWHAESLDTQYYLS